MNIRTSNLSQITVAILAGGFGTRLAPVLPHRQKIVVKVGKRPFLEYILDQLNKAGFKRVVICTGYLGDQISKAFSNSYKSLTLVYSKEQSPLGTAGAIRLALPFLKSKTILVINGDTFCDVDFKKFWQFHLDKNSNATLILSSVPDNSRFGKVVLGKGGSIIGFQEKKAARLQSPERSDGGQGSGAGFVNAGIYLINKAFISEILQEREISLEKDVFPNWIGKGFYGYKSNNNFIDIGTPESYAQAEQFFAKYKL